MVLGGSRDGVRFIADCGVSACLLEVSAEKPGNVTPTKSFEGTSYADFVAGSKALQPVFEKAAAAGFNAAAGKKTMRNAGVGKLILEGVSAVKKSHDGGNTHLGILVLFTPLLAAAGFCVGGGKRFDGLKDAASRVVYATSTEDALKLYEAVNLAGAGGLGSHELDVRDPASGVELRRRELTLLDVMRLSASRDDVAKEISENYEKTFEAAGFIEKIALEKRDLNTAITQTFILMLSKYPDTLIARKCGRDAVEDVSRRAKEVLESGGVLTEPGRLKTEEFDGFLRNSGNQLNPGTTADIIAAGLLVMLLKTNHPQ